MNREQREQLKSWGIDPKTIKTKSNINPGHVLLGVFIGIVITVAFVQLEISPQWVTDQTCDNYVSLAYQQGIIDISNYTTITGNFTYINNGSIQTQGVQDYCVALFQNLNTQEVNQNG